MGLSFPQIMMLGPSHASSSSGFCSVCACMCVGVCVFESARVRGGKENSRDGAREVMVMESEMPICT